MSLSASSPFAMTMTTNDLSGSERASPKDGGDPATSFTARELAKELEASRSVEALALFVNASND